jgi:DNA processing protein
LLTEAVIKSGAIITVRFCAEYEKGVFAVPGNIYSTVSKGTNELIQNGNLIALGPDDMAKQLEWVPKDKPVKTDNTHKLDKLELEVLNLIENDSDGLPLDLIAQKLNIETSEIALTLLKLEANGLIKTTPDKNM